MREALELGCKTTLFAANAGAGGISPVCWDNMGHDALEESHHDSALSHVPVGHQLAAGLPC